jgi:hypothetical protein
MRPLSIRTASRIRGRALAVAAALSLALTAPAGVAAAVPPGPPPDLHFTIPVVAADWSTVTIEVTWGAADGYGYPILSYYAVANPVGAGAAGACSTPVLSCRMSGLATGGEYQLVVIAVSQNGGGAPAVMNIGLDVAPSPPRDFSASLESWYNGYAQLRFSWTSPAHNGGTSIDGYKVITTNVDNGPSCKTTGALSCTMGGFYPGVTYTFTVMTSTTIFGFDPAYGTTLSYTVPAAPTLVPSLTAVATKSAAGTFTPADTGGSGTTQPAGTVASPGSSPPAQTGTPGGGEAPILPILALAALVAVAGAGLFLYRRSRRG